MELTDREMVHTHRAHGQVEESNLPCCCLRLVGEKFQHFQYQVQEAGRTQVH